MAFPCITHTMVLNWSITQVLDITEQLDAGVRYLHLQIALMLDGSEKNLQFVHMVYTMALVEVRPGWGDARGALRRWPASHGEPDCHRDGRFLTFSGMTMSASGPDKRPGDADAC
nr:PI-PLC X domain-containing protein 1-like [Aotus nancymaae]